MTNVPVSKNFSDNLSNSNVNTLFIRQFEKKSEGRQLRHDDILNHFSAFGIVKTVRIQNKQTRLYGFVTFASTESVAKALETEFHSIGEHTVEVSVAYKRHQSSSLSDLNDDCIFEILSMECLSIEDLCSIADTSCRLRNIARQVFRRKQEGYDIYGSVRDLLRYKNVKAAERVFINFGSLMSHLRLYLSICCNTTLKILHYVAKYCGNTLKSLCLSGDADDVNVSTQLEPFLKNMQILEVNDFFMEVDGKLFSVCESLVELNIKRDTNCALIIDNTFPKLEILKCESYFGEESDDDFDDDSDDDSDVESDDEPDVSFDSFILRHKDLKVFNIAGYKIKSSLPSLIADNCKQLERLRCKIPTDTTFDLQNLNHLLSLSIHCNERKVTESALGWNSLKGLEEVRLTKAHIDSKFVKILSHLEKLRSLKMVNCTGIKNLYRIANLERLAELHVTSKNSYVEIDLVYLVKRLSNLTRIGFKMDKFSMDADTYWEIVGVVGKRSNGSRLTISIYYDNLFANIRFDKCYLSRRLVFESL